MKSEKGAKFISLKVKTLNHSIFEIFANINQPIFSVQGQIQQKTSVPIAAQRLLYRGMHLQPTRTFANYEINQNNVLSLIANKIPSQFSQNSSIRRSQISKIKVITKEHLKFKKHMKLQQRTGGFRIMQSQALQVLAQNKQTIWGLIECANYNYGQESQPFKLQKRKLKVGQWVDARDMSGQWAQAQVVAQYGDYVKVHYNGWPQRMNEWISQSSDRLMPFRVHTVQAQDTNYLSPFPKYQAILSKTHNTHFQPSVQNLISSVSSTLQNFTKLLKDLQLQDHQSLAEHQNFMLPEQSTQNFNQPYQQSVQNLSSNAQLTEQIDLQMKDIDEVELDKKQEFYTPSKQIRANDNLSNKAEDDVVSKCDKDDISNKSNKSFKSKRSEGLVDTQSMKSLIRDQKKRMNNIFFDSTEAQSVKSVKNTSHVKYHYLNQEYIVEESDSQVNDQQDNENFLSFRKKQYKRKMKASQIAPLSDRIGRLLVDLAPHFAMLGYQEQSVNNFSENLSTFTNQGSLESKLAKANKIATEQEEKNNVHYHQSTYCQFQVPVMLTPNEITKLTRLLEQERRQNNVQI